MKTVSMFPITPGTRMLVDLPTGAQPLSVSLNVHQYYLHALHDMPIAGFEKRAVAAFMDQAPIHVELGPFLGTCKQSGEYRRWHFFDQGLVTDVPALEGMAGAVKSGGVA